ncbi:ThuA domain-containing protein [Luteolibacter sp. SL250]|uniref:ThuA domain-containing protein n=1 Tax=Luteolibacter sp. SL250 TaxID=2995170 RepID=UPI00226E54BA|nr:ThuA domain-containing protein [Luteolibacter sp. SL250]WAC21509.1 ThuA domain-containing protein [Luteolibacter sp. SL250]
MKAILPTCLLGAVALFVVAQNPAGEQPPAGASEKIAAALPAEAYAKPKKARKVLVFSKTGGFRHASIATGKLAFTEMGKKTGAFETVVSDDLGNFEADKLKQFDGVMFLSTTMNPFLPSKAELEKLSEDEKKAAVAAAKEKEGKLRENLMAWIKGGGAFIGIHAATDTFYDWAEYGEMVNGYFDGHPWNAGTQVSIKVEPGQEKHPLVAMFDGQNVDFKEEIYQLKAPYDSSKVHMLLRLDPEKSDMNVKGLKREDKDWGVAWARHWGKGRVFYCSLGHNHDMYWHPKVVRHYLAGIQWALGDYEVEVTK